MNCNSLQKSKIVGFAILQCLLAAILFFSLKTAADQLSAPNKWTSFLVWRLPALLASSSILLRVICKKVLLKTSKLLITIDNYFWGSALVGILIQLFSPFSSHPQLWFGLFFLALWAAKSILLISALFNIQKHDTINGKILFFVFFWFFCIHALWQVPVHSIQGDEPHYLLMAHSLVHDGDLNLYNEYSEKVYQDFHPDILEPKPSDFVAPGQIYSRGLGATFSTIFTPFYALFGYHGAHIFTILCAALLISQLYQLVSTSCSNPTTVLISVILIASTCPVLIYSSLIYPDILAALLIVIGLRILKIPQLSRTGRSVPTLIIIVATVLLFTKFRYFIPVLLLLVPVFFRELKKRYNWAVFLTTVTILGVLYFVFDRFILSGDLFLNRFGDLTRISFYLPTIQDLRVLPGLLLDQESGLFVLSPVYLLVFAGVFLYRGKKDSLYWFSILGAPLTALSLLGHFAWHSLPTPPLRYLLPLLPPTAIFMAHSLHEWKNRSIVYRFLAVVCISVSWLHAWLITLQPDWQINLATGTAAIFQDLARVLKSPIPILFPSVIRPNIALIPWSIFFCFMLLVFFYPALRDRKNRFIRLAPITMILLIMTGIIFVSAISKFFYLPIYHLEDQFQVSPDGGFYYPENRDPFHHREISYGWTFSQGSSAWISLVGKEENFVCLARCKLIDSWLPQKLIISAKDSPDASIRVTSKQWKLYAFKQSPLSAINAINVRSAESNSGSIAVDYIRIIRKSSLKSNIWIKLADVTRWAGFKTLPLLCDRNALLTFPGDSWFELNNYFTLGAQPPRPRIAQEHPLPVNILDNTLNDAITAGWNKAHEFESIFNFSFSSKIPKAQLLDYAIDGVLKGHQPSAKVMIRLDVDGETNSDLFYLKSIAYFLQRRIIESANSLDDFLIQGQSYPMCLTEPSKHVSVNNPFWTFFNDMENNIIFSRHARNICNQHLVKSIDAFDEGDFQTAALSFNQYYSSDHKIFAEKIPFLPSDFLIQMFKMSSRIHFSDIKSIAEQLLKRHRPEIALAASQYALRTNAQHSDARWLYTRSLFHMEKYNQVKLECLENIALSHNNDNYRWLLETIKKEIASAGCLIDNDDVDIALY